MNFETSTCVHRRGVCLLGACGRLTPPLILLAPCITLQIRSLLPPPPPLWWLPPAEIVDMLQPGQINNTQVEAAFQSFASILAAADARRKQRNTVRWSCQVIAQHIACSCLATPHSSCSSCSFSYLTLLWQLVIYLLAVLLLLLCVASACCC